MILALQDWGSATIPLLLMRAREGLTLLSFLLLPASAPPSSLKASADKLIRELELFGKDFSGYKEQAEVVAKPAAPVAASSPNVEKATKGKLAGKATGLKYQFQILESIGVPREEIHKFADAAYWLEYFPPIAKVSCKKISSLHDSNLAELSLSPSFLQADCTAFGARIDWRRAFFTTDINPFYDSFVRWQMNKLRALNKIKFGERYTIYSPKDGQPCMDHDRSEGEALGPQEYTALKMEVAQWSGEAANELEPKIQGKKVFFVAATLRPETMYGQTNCYVGPNIDYGLFKINETDVYLCTERAARNMAFQGTTAERGQVDCIATIKGSKLIGTKINAPFAHYGQVYVLPMETVIASKVSKSFSFDFRQNESHLTLLFPPFPSPLLLISGNWCRYLRSI